VAKGKAGSAARKAAVLDPTEVRIAFLVHDVSRMRRTLFDQVVRPVGVTRSQWWVLANLSRPGRDGTITQSELAQILEVGKVSIGGLVDRLENSGLVTRISDPSDRRTKRIKITTKGHQTIGEMLKLSLAMNAKVLNGISQRKVTEAEEVLHRMKSNIRDELELTKDANSKG
jgi:MarR family transcriptional regulator, transcriptional regulator for hemolysin